ncbi:MAG: thiamine pyrophosphate-dependent dehydrogenase component subunit alpha [Hydrocarboniphaga sp.]|uniref:thiamine pyrophosphate-dependent dehydrogenase E1 component subunit alpha n=1 Tax=Hydrocarboniphaga sp. TaxID=2033016 RepID=UPI00262850D4|nr:thiamine pyrophosphate-dependent dehydrogenase E1 component subunit alpha [Hydrocarboniphaga sp.]MDB5971479.1 thiamine pyrophosphate-dependent dehydrogenase component subunit alpha [Hydrocarboniphaga sp.]
MGMTQPDSKTLVAIYKKMALIKHSDDRVIGAMKAGRMQMPYYSARGQECIPAAISTLLTDEDYLVTIYRGVHDMLAKGLPAKLLWAELAGKATGSCKGKGGPMHLTYPSKGCMVTTGIVGASMPIACGLALASQLRGETRVTVANFGDGASNIGAFHESLNLASVWKLPVILVCQNNRFAEHTSYAKGTSVAKIANRAASYDMPGLHVDGNDPVAVYQAAQQAIERARSGGGPTLIEALTFRFNGHLIGDMGEYIPKAEYAAAVAADPYPKYRSWLIDNRHATSAEIEAIEAGIKAEIDEAEAFAMSSPPPDAIEVKRDVYAYDIA